MRCNGKAVPISVYHIRGKTYDPYDSPAREVNSLRALCSAGLHSCNVAFVVPYVCVYRHTSYRLHTGYSGFLRHTVGGKWVVPSWWKNTRRIKFPSRDVWRFQGNRVWTFAKFIAWSTRGKIENGVSVYVLSLIFRNATDAVLHSALVIIFRHRLTVVYGVSCVD